jgi:hypothetical protein
MLKHINDWLTPPKDWEPNNPMRELEWADMRVMEVLAIVLVASIPLVIIVVVGMAYVIAR